MNYFKLFIFQCYFLILNIYLANGSTYYHNYYLYRYPNGKWEILPWDMDKTLSYYDWMPYQYHRTSSEWESDNPLDESKLGLLNEAEIMILEASAAREISPSDAELQARLEVGRPRLSQIYNELFRSGLLSVRKQGRKRLFRISEAANSHFGG